MNATKPINLNHFAQVPAEIINKVLKPRALQILNHLLKCCSLKKALVWVNQSWLAKQIGVHIETIGRWIRYLEKQGWLKFTGQRKQGRLKVYEIVFEKDSASSIFAGGPPAKIEEDVLQNCWNINKEERTELKEQTAEDIVVEISLRKILHAYGINKNAAKRLIAKYPAELLNKQVEHLKLRQSHGDQIKSTAAWLVRAIQEDYALPMAHQEEVRAENTRQAQRLLQEALYLERIGQVADAKAVAQKSLEIVHSKEAAELVGRIDARVEKNRRIEQARKNAPRELLERLIKEATEKVQASYRRLGIRALPEIASLAIEAEVGEKLISF
jgi:hypothetical protein